MAVMFGNCSCMRIPAAYIAIMAKFQAGELTGDQVNEAIVLANQQIREEQARLASLEK